MSEAVVVKRAGEKRGDPLPETGCEKMAVCGSGLLFCIIYCFRRMIDKKSGLRPFNKISQKNLQKNIDIEARKTYNKEDD